MRKKTRRDRRGVTEKQARSGGGLAQSRPLSRRALLGVALGGAGLALIGERRWRSAIPVDPAKTPISVYASPSCRCCHRWTAHLAENGFDVREEKVPNVEPFKRKYAIPERLWSCHTAAVEGYAIEGHVPADLIQRLVRERPAVVGLAAPGMPNGSPGMEGNEKDTYEVLSFTRNGDSQVYAVR